MKLKEFEPPGEGERVPCVPLRSTTDDREMEDFKSKIQLYSKILFQKRKRMLSVLVYAQINQGTRGTTKYKGEGANRLSGHSFLTQQHN